jgi:hypothetical protein
VTQDSRDENIVTSDFTKHGVVWFKPPTPPSSSSRGNSSDSDLGSPPSLMTWMTCMEPCQYSKVIGTIELDDFIQEFDNWCDMM